MRTAFSLHTKLMLAITVLVALVLGGLAYVQIESVRARMLSELEQRATLFATLLSHSLAQPLWNADTRAIDLQLAAPFDDGEVAEIVVDALNYGIIAKKKKPDLGDTVNPVVRVLPIDYSAFPNSPAQRIGDVRVVFSRATTDTRIAEYQRAVALISAAILVGLYIATFVLFRRMVYGPIQRLEETVDRVAAGDMRARSQVESRDELGRLAERFNDMADRLLKSSTELRTSEARFRTFVDHANDAFFLHDEQGVIIDVNRQACESLGYSRKELIGKHPRDFDVGLDAASIESLRQRIAAEGTSTFETIHRHKDGSVFPVEIRSRAFEQGGTRFLSLVRDITERKRASNALSEVRSQLAHANRSAALGQLTASIAHEVNQPVAGALSSGQAALRWLDKHDLDAARHAIERVIRDTTRAGAVISSVRTLVQKMPQRAESLDINDAILEIIVIARGEAQQNGISVETRLAENLSLVRGDRVQLQQVLMNLIINAIEAMSGAGEGLRELIIKTAQTDLDFVSVAVQDSGPGLDPEHLSRAFEAFYTTKSAGMGMGLSICRSIVEAHGGTLTMTANVPHGAIFQFMLPVQQDSG